MNSKSESAAHENPTANAKIEDLERQLADAFWKGTDCSDGGSQPAKGSINGDLRA
jgi:hypothetical protein